MRIIELKSSNIKRIKAVELHLDEKQNLVLITGKNAQGKTSILDSIWYALGGKKAVQDKPIREGEEKAEIEIDVNGYLVKRTFTGKSSYLQVTNKDGSKYSNPQEFLDYIIGNLSFDPLEFSHMDEKKQIIELTKVVGLDLAPFDEKKKKLTEERLFVGREMKTIGQISPVTVAAMKNVSQEPINIAEAQERWKAAVDIRNRYNNLLGIEKSMEDEIKDLNERLTTLNKNLSLTKKEIAGMKVEEPNEVYKEVERLTALVKDQDEAKRIIAEDAKYQAKDAEYRKLTEDIKAVDEEKAKKLAAVKMPIDGLSWDEERVLYKGIPFIQGSAAEQLRVSMAIAMASNPKLKVILIRDGSLLDADNLKVVEEMARDKDFQVWIETVSDDGKVGIFVEDGMVKSIDGIPI